MKIKEALSWGQAQLLEHKKDDAYLAPGIFLCFVLNCTQSYILAHPENVLDAQSCLDYQNCIKQRAKNIPVAYIVGAKEFYGLTFKVNQDVLIPRPESEMIIDYVRSMQLKDVALTILDVGTGSGILAITLKHYLPKAEVYAVDISLKALAVAQENAKHLQKEVYFLQGDLLKNFSHKVDLMVCNLPYVAYEDEQALSNEVKQEPYLALFAEKSGLALYEELIQNAGDHLNWGGKIVCEYGIGQSDALKQLFEKNHFKVIECKQDLAGIERMMVAQYVSFN